MHWDVTKYVILFIIAVSIQYTLNKILYELKEIKKNLIKKM